MVITWQATPGVTNVLRVGLAVASVVLMLVLIRRERQAVRRATTEQDRRSHRLNLYTFFAILVVGVIVQAASWLGVL